MAMLASASAAYAAGDNNYAGTAFSFSKGAGTKSHPVGVSFKETLKAKNNDATKAAAVLTNIKTKIYGLVNNGQYFPTCSGSKMLAQKSDKFCPKKSKSASGFVNSLLGGTSLALSKTTACNPDLDSFNAGKNKLWFFFTTHSALQCNGLTTGATAPWQGRISYQGKYEVLNVPLPIDISTQVAGITNLYGSLIKQQLNWYKYSTKVKGKTVYNNASIGCLHGKRPWSVTFTSTTNGSNRQTGTVSGSAKC